MSLLYSPSLSKSSPARTEAWLGTTMLGGSKTSPIVAMNRQNREDGTNMVTTGTPAAPAQHHHPRRLGGWSWAHKEGGGGGRGENRHRDDPTTYGHLYVLPVLLLEFLALALTRAVIPGMLLRAYGSRVYLVMGFADFVRGSLAFVASPLFGKISDLVGRRWCLLVTVLGTCAPVCSLAFFSWDNDGGSPPDFSALSTVTSNPSPAAAAVVEASASNATVLLEAFFNVSESSAVVNFASESAGPEESGVWPAVPGGVPTSNQEAQGDHFHHPLALTVFIILLSLSGIFSSTFTLVFAYISDTVRSQEERVSAYGLALATFGLSFTIGPMAGGYLAKYDRQRVFLASLFLTVLDLIYIYLFLPESRPAQDGNRGNAKSSNLSALSQEHNISWKPWETLRIVALDPFLRKVGEVAFLYYTGLWAIISTLSVYAVKRFHLTPERLGELMSALGLCTMVAEAVLVRIVVPLLGEKASMRVGLASFCVQCAVLGFAYEGWHLFVCVAFSLAGNLVYPSLASLVSGSVEPGAVGEALGAVNGIKALTEGIGPLLFGSLMTLSEHSRLPGWPYLLASVLILAAYRAAGDLPDPQQDDYVHELDQKRRYQCAGDDDGSGGILLRVLDARDYQGEDDEYEGLLSDIDDSDVDGDTKTAVDDEDVTRLPPTFASLIKKSFSPKRR